MLKCAQVRAHVSRLSMFFNSNTTSNAIMVDEAKNNHSQILTASLFSQLSINYVHTIQSSVYSAYISIWPEYHQTHSRAPPPDTMRRRDACTSDEKSQSLRAQTQPLTHCLLCKCIFHRYYVARASSRALIHNHYDGVLLCVCARARAAIHMHTNVYLLCQHRVTSFCTPSHNRCLVQKPK